MSLFDDMTMSIPIKDKKKKIANDYDMVRGKFYGGGRGVITRENSLFCPCVLGLNHRFKDEIHIIVRKQ